MVSRTLAVTTISPVQSLKNGGRFEMLVIFICYSRMYFNNGTRSSFSEGFLP